MRTADKAFHQCYNGQAAVDATCQVIVAADLSNQAADAPHLPALLGQVSANAGRPPRRPSPTRAITRRTTSAASVARAASR